MTVASRFWPMVCLSAIAVLAIGFALHRGPVALAQDAEAEAAAEGGASKRPLLLNVTSGFEDPHSVTMALQLAGHGLESGRAVHLFFNVRGVQVLARERKSPSVIFSDKPVAELLAKLVENGAKVWACPHCTRALGLGAEDLIEAAEFATAEGLFGIVDARAAVFTY